jgi:hypothetical protein
MSEIRFFRHIFCIVICALFGLLYVHQQVEIVKTGLEISSKYQKVSFLLDQYRSLVYNLSELESPKAIEQILSMNEIVLCAAKKANINCLEKILIADAKIIR